MPKPPTIITGRVAAITGAGRGIGRETARAFVREGMKVAIGDLDLEAAKATAAELGDRAIALQVDVTRHESVEAFLDAAEQQLGPLDVVVNNAGIMQLGWFSDEDDATAQRMIDINLHGVIFGTKAALARMEPRNHGHIVNIASQAGCVRHAGRRDVLGDQARRRRADRGGARRDAPARGQRPAQLRAAGGRQHRARLGAAAQPGHQAARAGRRRRGDRRRTAPRDGRRLGAEVGQGHVALRWATAAPRRRRASAA